MRKSIVSLAILGLLWAGPAAATTRKGKATPTKSPEFAFLSGGQTLVTLNWAKGAVDLDVVVFCLGIPVGIGAGFEDRYERVEFGLPAGIPCVAGVMAFDGSSKFTINVQATEGGGLAVTSASRKGPLLVPLSDEFPSLKAEFDRVKRMKALNR